MRILYLKKNKRSSLNRWNFNVFDDFTNTKSNKYKALHHLSSAKLRNALEEGEFVRLFSSNSVNASNFSYLYITQLCVSHSFVISKVFMVFFVKKDGHMAIS